jgi:hypothetical protein
MGMTEKLQILTTLRHISEKQIGKSNGSIKMNKIKIETQGHILEGKEYIGWGVFVQDLEDGQGSYLILITSPDHLEGYDNWVENREDLQYYFQVKGWKVEWFEKLETPPEIKTETYGRILQGEDAGWNVFIQDLGKGKGAYLISVKSPNNSDGYDRKVTNLDHLTAYFREANWKVEWFEHTAKN